MVEVMPDSLVEGRTKELGLKLYQASQGYKAPLIERLQDSLMIELIEHPQFRNHVLRFEDALAALDFPGSDSHVKRLSQEYFEGPLEGLPVPIRAALTLARSRYAPAPLVAWAARVATRAMASRFIAPAGIKGVLDALSYLQQYGRVGSFDILGEQVLSEEEADRHKEQYLGLIERLKSHPWTGKRTPGGVPCLQLSIKLSSLTSDFNAADPDGALSRIRPRAEEIFRAARQAGVGVVVDMEQFEYRDLTWSLFARLLDSHGPFGDWGDAGIVAQAYLVDAATNLLRMLSFARERGAPFQVRLVKGAYWDYETIVAQQMGWPAPVFQNKAEADVSFESLTQLLLRNHGLVHVAIGSHNIRSHAYAEAMRESLGLPPATIEHQVLYKTAEGVARALASQGWMVRDYVPVGELIPGMAYLVRRILENTSQVGFLTQNRLRAGVEELLRDPRTKASQGQAFVQQKVEPSFRTSPTKRLFDSKERGDFREALRRVRAEWGKEYPLKLDSEALFTGQVKASLSPSAPDPRNPVGLVHLADTELTEKAIRIANSGLQSWARVPLRERAAIARSAAGIMMEERDDLAAWIVHEGAKNWSNALADVNESIDHLNYNAAQILRNEVTIADLYRPRGVVAVIPPWNFPMAIPCGMVSAALLTGNAVILKPADPTPVIAHKLVDVLHRAGFPEDALILLPGQGRTVGARLVESPDVDMVAFTGSKDTGVRIYEQASRVNPGRGRIKRVVAEMGGKNPILVFPDADQDEAVRGILNSAFGHANQKCSACSRVFIHRSIYDRVLGRLVEGAASLEVGPADQPGTFINPLISKEAKERVLGYAEKARVEGRVLVDKTRECPPDSYCLGPLIAEVQPDQAFRVSIAQEEIFGPVLTVTPFEDESELIAMINSTPYALTAGIFSRSPSTVRRMARAVQVGNIYVNRDTTGARPGIEPFGGVNLSGTGPKAGGEEYIYAFLTRKARAVRKPLPQGDGTGGSAAEVMPAVRPWSEAELPTRTTCLQRALEWLEMDGRDRLREALASGLGVSGAEADEVAAGLLATAHRVLETIPEIDGPQPTVEVPGQKNFNTWETPRGTGLVAASDDVEPATLAGMVFGPLAAGNGVLVAASPAQSPLASILFDALHRAGVPRDILASVASDGLRTLTALAERPFHFAALDLSEEDIRAVYGVMGVTREAEGQKWLKALISMDEGPRPGETGFLRLFALPKTVAIRTLRHGADLELV